MKNADGSEGSYIRVMHPAFLHEKSGALTTFADAREGMEVTRRHFDAHSRVASRHSHLIGSARPGVALAQAARIPICVRGG